MINISFVMDKGSVAKVMNNIKTAMQAAQREGGEGLEEVGKYIMAESTAEVPFDTGTLRDTAYIKDAVYTTLGVTVEIGYGGPNDKRNPDTGLMASEYMLRVHEDIPAAYHHWYGKAHFLSDPVHRSEHMMYEILAGRLKYAFTLPKGVT